MAEYLIQKFIKLIEFDQQINKTEKHMQTLQKAVVDLENQLALAGDQFEKAKNQKHEARKLVDTKELEMKDLDEQEKKLKEKLDAVSNQREYKSIMQEIEKVQAKQHTFEQDVLDAWRALESAEKLHAEHEKKFEQERVSIQKSIDEKNAEIKTLQDTVNSLEQERPVYVEGINEELLEKYATMRKRISDPAVPITLDSCSACFTALPRQIVLNVQRGKLVQCLGCFRFLYEPRKDQQA